MGWIGTEDEEVYLDLPVLNPTPFTKEARAIERIDHEVALGKAVNNVAKLIAEREALRRKLENHRQGRQPNPLTGRVPSEPHTQ